MRLRYVAQYKDRTGKMRRYVRRKGQPLIPLHSRPGTKAFADEYERALGNLPNAARLAETSRLNEIGEIYFLDQGAYIKIGFSTDTGKRMKQHRTSLPALSVICTIPGSRRDDLEWRRKFKHLRVRGDWFAKDDDLLAFVDAVKRDRRSNSKFG